MPIAVALDVAVAAMARLADRCGCAAMARLADRSPAVSMVADVGSVDFHPNGEFIATGCSNGKLSVVNARRYGQSINPNLRSYQMGTGDRYD